MFSTAFNLALIVVGFGLLILVHEAGHFLAARWAGIRTEVFAIGMGTPVFSWRKGIGFAWGSTHRKVVALTGKGARDLSQHELDAAGIGATEYSLRWLPIGGFVKMLGQDDVDPGYTSTEPGSYNTCPIGKRMVVVSAGVVANIVLAVALFIVAFMAGVKFEMPVVGAVGPTLPAGTTPAVNADALGIEGTGLKPGDLITHIDGKPVRTFVDVTIATAMARPGSELTFTIDRPGAPEPLEFRLQPRKSAATGLLGVGIDPARSTRLFEDDAEVLRRILEGIGLAQQGIEPGMMMVAAAGRPIDTFEQFHEVVLASRGEPVATTWYRLDRDGPVGSPVDADVPVAPTYQVLRYAAAVPDDGQNYEEGLFGLTPLVRIVSVVGENEDVLEADDVILRAGAVDGPTMAALQQEIRRRAGGVIDLVVLRGGAEREMTAQVDRKGRLGIGIGWAWDVPRTAAPLDQVRVPPAHGEPSRTERTPVGDLLLMARTRIDAVDGTAVTDWPSMREAFREHTRAALDAGTGAVVELEVTHPTAGRERETVRLDLSSEQVAELHALPWASELPAEVFEPLYTTLSAGGNPFRAAAMGFEETHKVIVLTYLTIDRLVRGSVGVEQIRGPVGIVHIGAKVADRGVMYLVFFLGIISVNLAVINFLPLPIVDGGLFLYLVYEKLKGRPPPLGFQNAATLVGVALIATALLVVTWNDLMRLVG